MKNKGFTLIELLAVIIILAAIALVSFPILLNTIKNSEGQIDEVTERLVLNAAKLYVDNSLDNYSKKNGNVYCISFDALINNNYLEQGILDSDNSPSNMNIVKVSYNNGYNYEVVETCTEVK